MQRFKSGRTVPPGGRYFFEVPETKCVIEDLTWTGFLAKVRKHYADNELVCPDNLAEIAVDFMCRYLPERFCYGDEPSGIRAMTLSDVKAATLKLAYQNGRVPPGEARERMQICGACPRNDRSMCPTCVGLVAWAEKLAGMRPAGGTGEWLGICGVDGTALPATTCMENVPGGEDYPDNCWRKR